MKRKKLIIIVIIVISCIIYLSINSTYSSYESEVEATADSQIADWKIKVNDTLITGEAEQTITINDIEWDTTHTKENTIAPGTSGIITVIIDPTTTEVAFAYELTIIDKTVNPDKLLTVTKVESSIGQLTQENNVYKGVMLMPDIKAGNKDYIKIYATWDDNGQDVVADPNEQTTTEDMLEINFKAIQQK